jgi:hypothetical protein
MKTEQRQATTEIKTNIEVGSTVAREIDTSQLYRVVYITVDFKAVLVSKNSSDCTPSIRSRYRFSQIHNLLLVRSSVRIITPNPRN